MNVSPGKLTTLISGVVVFICGFLPWYSYGSGRYGASVNAWSEGFLPIATWAPLFALVVVVLVALPAFTAVKLPEKILDFTIDQLVLVASVFVFLITFGFVVANNGGSKGFGLILSVLGAIGLIVGYFLDKQGVGATPMADQGYVAPGGFPPAQQPQAPAPGSAPQPGQAPQAPAPGYNPQQPPQQPGQGSF